MDNNELEQNNNTIGSDVSNENEIEVLNDETKNTNKPKERDQQRLTPFIITFVLACLSFIGYVFTYVTFSSMLLSKPDDLGEGLGLIFGFIVILLPLFITFLLSLGFSIASAFCKKKMDKDNVYNHSRIIRRIFCGNVYSLGG